MTELDEEKRAAAEAAATLVQDGMAIGLGTGTTAYFVVEAVGRRVRQGLKIVAIPTSERTAEQARSEGIALTDFATHPKLDLTIDGADEIARSTLDLIKGLGGALLREKIVATSSRRLVIVADHRKIVDRLGATPIPIEVVPFGWETTAARIQALGGHPALRCDASGQPYRTDGNNLILDTSFGLIEDPAALEPRLAATLGVIATGLFVGLAEAAFVAGPQGIEQLKPTRTSPAGSRGSPAAPRG